MPAYDATGVLYATLERAISGAGGSLPSRSAVIAELSKTSGLGGTTGRLGFDPSGDTTNRVISILESPSQTPEPPGGRPARWTAAPAFLISAGSTST